MPPLSSNLLIEILWTQFVAVSFHLCISEHNRRQQARLIETGAGKLTQMYTKLVAEGSSGSVPAPGSDQILKPFPQFLLVSLEPLVVFLRTLPLPATHPSHPAAPAILTTLRDAQRGYADMRGSWIKKGLESQGKRVIDRAETVDAVLSGREFGKWVETLLTVAEVRNRRWYKSNPLI